MRKLAPPLPREPNNYLIFEGNPVEDRKCEDCGESIDLGDIQVNVKTREFRDCFYHLHCFQHFPLRINKKNSESKVNDTGKKAELELWIQVWNKQFDLRQEVFSAYTKKQVKSEAPVQRRAFLETFKYLDAVTLVLVAAKVCKAWYHISWEDELWKDLYQSVFLSVQTTSCVSKWSYLEVYYSSCLHCKQVLPDSERYMVCPLTFRPVCYSCYTAWEKRPHNIEVLGCEYRDSRFLPTTLKRYNLPIFSFGGSECIYSKQLLSTIGKVRKEVVEAILTRENEELDDLFGKKCFELLRNSTEKDFVFGRVEEFQQKLSDTSIYQCKLFEFILAGKTISEFDTFLASWKREKTLRSRLNR